MTILPIVQAPHPVLRKKCTPVRNFDKALHTLIDDMFETMYHAEGIGLAAPQIGVSIRLCIIDTGTHPDGTPLNSEDEMPGSPSSQLVLINPRITRSLEEKLPYDEGCLSLPGYEISVKRPANILVEFEDRQGKTQHQHFTDLPARCVQHEVDHLNGVLIVDYASQITRNRIFRALRQQSTSQDQSQ